MSLHPWLQRVHEHMLKTGAEYTVRDAVAAFGVPDKPASKLMHSAANWGVWFRTEERTFEGREGRITLYVFIAIEPRGKIETPPMARCNSVWQMAELTS